MTYLQHTLELLGIAAVIAGVYWLSPPVGVLAGGVLIVFLAQGIRKVNK